MIVGRKYVQFDFVSRLSCAKSRIHDKTNSCRCLVACSGIMFFTLRFILLFEGLFDETGQFLFQLNHILFSLTILLDLISIDLSVLSISYEDCIVVRGLSIDATACGVSLSAT